MSEMNNEVNNDVKDYIIFLTVVNFMVSELGIDIDEIEEDHPDLSITDEESEKISKYIEKQLEDMDIECWKNEFISLLKEV